MDLKQSVEKIIKDHMKSKGWPGINDKAILAELKPMWVLIEEAGLKQPGWTFKGFCQVAHDACIHAEIAAHFGG